MRLNRVVISAMLSCFMALPAVAMTHARRGPTSPSKPAARKRTPAKKTPPGPRVIDSERATQIQTALIKSGYMSGEASGRWDAQSEAAMQKLQADNGWQTKIVPDSRALIKLGLGPNYSAELLNGSPKTAAAATPSTTTASRGIEGTAAKQ